MSVPSSHDYVRHALASAPGKWFCLSCLPTTVRNLGGDDDAVSIAAAMVALRALAGFECYKGLCQCGREGYSRIRSTSR
jgi:hypothetical protein